MPTKATIGGSWDASSASTIERRCADVAVVGDSAIGFLTAYSLARKSKKVRQ
jgi:hypothetical protein